MHIWRQGHLWKEWGQHHFPPTDNAGLKYLFSEEEEQPSPQSFAKVPTALFLFSSSLQYIQSWHCLPGGWVVKHWPKQFYQSEGIPFPHCLLFSPNWTRGHSGKILSWYDISPSTFSPSTESSGGFQALCVCHRHCLSSHVLQNVPWNEKNRHFLAKQDLLENPKNGFLLFFLSWTQISSNISACRLQSLSTVMIPGQNSTLISIRTGMVFWKLSRECAMLVEIPRLVSIACQQHFRFIYS